MNIDELWDFQDPAGTEMRFREAIQKTGDMSLRAELGTQLARTLGLQHRFDEGFQALAGTTHLEVPMEGRFLVRYELEYGRLLNSSQRQEEALPHFHKAAEVAARCGEPGLEIDALHMIAIATKDSTEQLEWNLKAIARAESSSDERARKWLASLYNNTGWSLFELGRVAEALDLWKRAVPIREQMGQPVPLRIARWCVARGLRELGDIEGALAIQEEIVLEPDSGPYVQEELAYLLVDRDPARSAACAKTALETLGVDDYFVQYESARHERLKQLAQLG